MKSRKNRLKERAELLELLKKIPKTKRAKIVKLFDDNTIHNICECLCNLFKNTFKLPPKKCGYIRKKFGGHRSQILKLIDPNTSVKKKKDLLSSQQIGSGLFTILASVALPAIIGALTGK